MRNEKLVQLLDTVVELPQISETDDEHIKLSSRLECDFVIVNHARNEKMIYNIKRHYRQMGRFK